MPLAAVSARSLGPGSAVLVGTLALVAATGIPAALETATIADKSATGGGAAAVGARTWPRAQARAGARAEGPAGSRARLEATDSGAGNEPAGARRPRPEAAVGCSPKLAWTSLESPSRRAEAPFPVRGPLPLSAPLPLPGPAATRRSFAPIRAWRAAGAESSVLAAPAGSVERPATPAAGSGGGSTMLSAGPGTARGPVAAASAEVSANRAVRLHAARAPALPALDAAVEFATATELAVTV